MAPFISSLKPADYLQDRGYWLGGDTRKPSMC